MAKSDRKLTLEEVLKGSITSEYLDKKESVAIISRHITALANKRFDIDDKISVVSKTEILINERQKLTGKIEKLQLELNKINNISPRKENNDMNETTFEVCPHCNNEVLIDADKSSKCPVCNNIISPCTTCDRSIDCSKCNK